MTRPSRTRAYIRKRRRRAAGKPLAPAKLARNDGTVIFDHGAKEFPTAIVRPRETGARARAALHDLRAWFGARWAWVRPRTVPLLVAAGGMAFVLMSADYLAHEHGARQHHVPAFRTAPHVP